MLYVPSVNMSDVCAILCVVASPARCQASRSFWLCPHTLFSGCRHTLLFTHRRPPPACSTAMRPTTRQPWQQWTPRCLHRCLMCCRRKLQPAPRPWFLPLHTCERSHADPRHPLVAASLCGAATVYRGLGGALFFFRVYSLELCAFHLLQMALCVYRAHVSAYQHVNTCVLFNAVVITILIVPQVCLVAKHRPRGRVLVTAGMRGAWQQPPKQPSKQPPLKPPLKPPIQPP